VQSFEAPAWTEGALQQIDAAPDKVRRFLIRYQDRILYGSDDNYGPGDSDSRAVAEVHSGWTADWRFLATWDELHSSDFAQSFKGLYLPREVIDKIYGSTPSLRSPAPGGFGHGELRCCSHPATVRVAESPDTQA
jgi:hypothetical protein